MKKKLKDRKGVKIAASFLKGALKDTIYPVAGVVIGGVQGVKESVKAIKQENKNDETGGLGKPNYVRWFGFGFAVFSLLILLGQMVGWIDLEQAEALKEAADKIGNSLPTE